jgi:hypothetical protein
MSQTPFNFPCTNCGAHLVVDGSTQTPVCAYCHMQTLLPEDVWLRFHPRVATAIAPAPQLIIDASASVNAAKKIVPVILIMVVVILAVTAFSVFMIFSQVSSSIPKISGPTSLAAPSAVGNAGDACAGRTNACSSDKKAYLTCGAGDKLAVAASCKGPNGCRVSSDGDNITCDFTFADVKDPCDTTDDACSTDHKAELACVAGKYAVRATCKGPDGCTLSPGKKGGSTISCDDHIADVGDPCFDSERTACSADHKSLLTCTAQKYVVDRACKGPKGCTMTKDIGGKTMTVDCSGYSR